MKKLLFTLLLLSCSHTSDEEKYRELFQQETNLSASVHDLSQMVLRLDSIAQPDIYRTTKGELVRLQKTLDSLRQAMRELPGHDSIEVNKYTK